MASNQKGAKHVPESKSLTAAGLSMVCNYRSSGWVILWWTLVTGCWLKKKKKLSKDSGQTKQTKVSKLLCKNLYQTTRQLYKLFKNYIFIFLEEFFFFLKRCYFFCLWGHCYAIASKNHHLPYQKLDRRHVVLLTSHRVRDPPDM